MTTFIILGVVATLFVLLSLVVFVNKSIDKSFTFSLDEVSFNDEDVMYELVYKKIIDRDFYKEE
jgi:hypothetical protein